MDSPAQFQKDVSSGERFRFGANWRRFLDRVDQRTLEQAAQSVRELVGETRFEGLKFLDAGSGSGLFSAAARSMGCQVTSFDYDEQSFECTNALRQRFPALATGWQVQRGSLLDKGFMDGLGSFDIVYCWGVAHHTGKMWEALANVAERVAPGGRLAISIYNDQGKPSGRWLAVKRLYNKHPVLRPLLLAGTWFRLWAVRFVRDALRGNPLKSWRAYGAGYRGMSAWHDLVDWVGGYPFEVAKPEQMFEFFKGRGFRLDTMRTRAGDIGCNEFVFTRVPAAV
jgi:2-polyprenyl-6-hydroxyphenyl methylase/3-demethylubiquinone-9 3-methyltransferase